MTLFQFLSHAISGPPTGVLSNLSLTVAPSQIEPGNRVTISNGNQYLALERPSDHGLFVASPLFGSEREPTVLQEWQVTEVAK